MTTDIEAELDRLRIRLDRERKARRQAEVIAERGMRELWGANRELQARVARRTSSLEHLTAGLDVAHRARDVAAAKALADAGADADAEAVRAAVRTVADRTPAVPYEPCGPDEIGDLILGRWQRPAAAAGQLLVVDAGTGEEVAGPWAHVLGAAELILGSFVAHGAVGTLTVSITATSPSLGVSVRGGMAEEVEARTGRPTSSAWRFHLDAIEVMAEAVGARLDVVAGREGSLELSVSVVRPT